MRVVFTREGERDLSRLSKEVGIRIATKILWLAEHIDEQVPQPLGYEFKGLFKLRIGDWRVLYEVDRGMRAFVVHMIDHRSRIYGRRRR